MTDPSRRHPRGVNAGNASRGVFDAHALVRCRAQGACRGEMYLRVGLGSNDPVGVDHGIEQIGDAQAFEQQAGVAARGGQGRLEAGLAQLFDRLARAGQQVLRPEMLDLFAVIVVLACSQRVLFGFRVGRAAASSAISTESRRSTPSCVAGGIVERQADFAGQAA